MLNRSKNNTRLDARLRSIIELIERQTLAESIGDRLDAASDVERRTGERRNRGRVAQQLKRLGAAVVAALLERLTAGQRSTVWLRVAAPVGAQARRNCR